MYVCIYIYIYIYIYMYYIHTNVCTHMYAHTHTHTHTHTCTPIFSTIHKNSHARTYAHAHTHTHTPCAATGWLFTFACMRVLRVSRGWSLTKFLKKSAPHYIFQITALNDVLLRLLAETTLTSPRAPQQIQRAHREGARESRAHAAKRSRLRLSRQRQSPRRPRTPPPAAVSPAPSLLLQSPRRPQTPPPGGVSPVRGRGPVGRCGAEWAGLGGRAPCACWHECRPRTLSTEPQPAPRPEPRAPTTGACARVGLDPVADRIHAALPAAAAVSRPPFCCSPVFRRGEPRCPPSPSVLLQNAPAHGSLDTMAGRLGRVGFNLFQKCYFHICSVAGGGKKKVQIVSAQIQWRFLRAQVRDPEARACWRIDTIQHIAGSRPAASRDARDALVVWPINSAGSSLTNARLGTSLSPTKAEQRRGASPAKASTSFYWESGDRLSLKASTPAYSQRSESVSGLSQLDRGRSREPRCLGFRV
jgi:hypothetical protein